MSDLVSRLPEVRLTEEQVREVIERAARLPARSDLVSVSELRQIAMELDVDPDALEEALSEVLDVDHAPAPKRSLARKVQGALAGGVLGAGSALIGAALAYFFDNIIVTMTSSLFVDTAVTLALVWLTLSSLRHNRREGRLRDYLLEVGTLWATFVGAWTLVHGGPGSDVNALGSIAFALSVVVGLLALRGKTPPTVDTLPVSVDQDGLAAGDSSRVIDRPGSTPDSEIDLKPLRLAFGW